MKRELWRCRAAGVRPARLGLARISVVRGEGPQAGTAAIDDYVRTLEPVTDYLTKWSGLVRAAAPRGSSFMPAGSAGLQA